jgi:hypothetical protein
MNEFESSLVTLLRAKAGDASGYVDDAQAAARIDLGLDRIDRRRRRVRTAALVAAAAVVVAVLVVLTRVPLDDSAPLEPSGSLSSLAPVGPYTITSDPFMADGSWEHIVRRPGVEPPRLAPCITDPRTWGAAESRTATYDNSGAEQGVLNEFVLVYHDPEAAHSSLLDAWQQALACREPANVDNPMSPPGPSERSAAIFDEGFANQRAWPPTTPTDQYGRVYALRVLRSGNVLIVIEDTGIPTDRSEVLMAMAAVTAVKKH